MIIQEFVVYCDNCGDHNHIGPTSVNSYMYTEECIKKDSKWAVTKPVSDGETKHLCPKCQKDIIQLNRLQKKSS